GRLLNVPYNLETNDYTLVLTARLPGPEVSRAVTDHFDQLWRGGERHRRAVAIGLHSFIFCQPAGAGDVREYLEHMKAQRGAWLTTSDAIYESMVRVSPSR